MSFKINSLLILLIGTALALVGCGKADHAKANEKAETQVVAKVNGDEISIHQINFQLGRMVQNNQAQLTEIQSKEAAKQILARLIDQQLLKQKALEAKLDRDPRVLQAMEASKNEILAQAYLEQLMSKAEKPSSTEVDDFYVKHPELFEKRRIFRLQELVVDVGQDKYQEIETDLKKINGINEIATWLKNKNYPFTANSNVRTAEQVPLELLKKIQPLKDGEFVVVPTPQSLSIVHIAASQNAPITRDKADPIIEQYFVNQNKTSLAKKEMLALKDKAKVEYVGAFADLKNNSKESSATTEAVNQISSTESVQASPESAKSTTITGKLDHAMAKPPKAEQANMEKGLSGL
jgi:EpsD family peptidyl-prolyl cis-trans isomerase